MKRLLTTLLLSLSTFFALAQQSSPSSLRTRIADDSQTLSIQVDGFQNNRNVHYNQRFDVSGMNGLQKELVKYRAYSAAGVTLPLHEMPWLISTCLGLLAIISVVWVMRSQAKKNRLIRPA